MNQLTEITESAGQDARQDSPASLEESREAKHALTSWPASPCPQAKAAESMSMPVVNPLPADRVMNSRSPPTSTGTFDW